MHGSATRRPHASHARVVCIQGSHHWNALRANQENILTRRWPLLKKHAFLATLECYQVMDTPAAIALNIFEAHDLLIFLMTKTA